MSSETTAATQYRLQEWAMQIKDCRNRPEKMTVQEWCEQNGITKSNYYYRLRQVRKACLDDLPQEISLHPVIPVDTELLGPGLPASDIQAPGLDIQAGSCSIHVSETTPMDLLAAVLEVIGNAQ